MIPAKNITVIKTISATGAKAAAWYEPHGSLQSVVDSPAPGFIRNVMLGAEGLQIRHADHLVCLPLALILAMAEQVQPALKPPTPATVEKMAATNAPLVPKPKE